MIYIHYTPQQLQGEIVNQVCDSSQVEVAIYSKFSKHKVYTRTKKKCHLLNPCVMPTVMGILTYALTIMESMIVVTTIT
jgi:hypothetical protein